MADERGPPDADRVVRLLGLEPHPEGGAYRETFRDPRLVIPAGEEDGESATGGDATDEPDPASTAGGTAAEARECSTAIYYLLRAGETSHWHRVDATEVWHHYAGAPLELEVSPDGRRTERHLLGDDLDAGERPQAVVPAGAWQRARSRGAWTLVGCTVAPAFRFEGFELAPPDWAPGDDPSV